MRDSSGGRVLKNLLLPVWLVFLLLGCPSVLVDYDRYQLYHERPSFLSPEYDAFTLREASVRADLIVRVIILRRLWEGSFWYPASYYEASVQKVYKGDVNREERVVVRQAGNRRVALEGVPLMRKGETYILFLGKEKRGYDVLGQETGMFRICSLDQQEYIIHSLGYDESLHDMAEPVTEKNRKIWDMKKPEEIWIKVFKIEAFEERLKEELGHEKLPFSFVFMTGFTGLG